MATGRGQAIGSGTNDDDVVIQLERADAYDTFLLMSTAGAMEVLVSLDGTNYSTAPLSLTDMGSEFADPVIITVASRVYGFRGLFRAVRVVQNGATAVENATLSYGTMT